MAIIGIGSVFAQTSMPSISMPEISSPSMPSVSMPSLSSSENTNSSTNKNNENKTTSNTTGSGLTATALLGLSNTTGLDTLSALLGVSDTTSSTDASTISSLSSISSLLSGDSSLSALSGLSSTQSNSPYSNYLLLSQIIEKLNELSKKLDETNNSAVQPNASQTSDAIQTTTTTREIMRFRINGSNILSSITEVYISKPETDGSFLLTADRTYTADYKKRTETFYMFFTPTTDNKSSYLDVSVSVLQDYENKNSFLYRLADFSEQTSISAKKTGRLISIIINNPSFKVDFLLSLD
ncbi:MAG: hypothetical protein J5647_04985 [Spirochaetaceae bacterium]|nr:hypothetical protein [Spirochaetaceae bacterium]